MSSNGQRRSIIDADIHQRIKSPKDLYPYLSKAYQRDMDVYGLRMPGGGYLNGGQKDPNLRADAWFEDGTNAGQSVEALAEMHLDPFNVEYGILLGQEIRPVSTLPDFDYASALAAAYNDWMIEHWLDKDDRLKGAAIVAPQLPDRAAQELDRVCKHEDMIAVLLANGARFPYGQRFYDPIYEKCVELDIPVVIHTGSEGSGINGQPTPVGYPSYYVELRQGRAMGYQTHMASMIFEGLFERFPTLKVVFVEGGYTWVPDYLWRLDADWKGLRHQTPWVKRAPSEYVFDHCLFTTQPMPSPPRQRQLLTIFEWARAEKTLMFASDFPHWDNDSPDLSLPQMPEEMANRVFSENARELYKLPKKQEALTAD